MAGATATALVGLLLFVQPRRGRIRFEQLQRDVLVDPGARIAFYRVSIVSAWVTTAIVASIGALAAVGGHSVALPSAPSDRAVESAWGLTIEMIVLIPLSALLLRSRRERIQRLVARQIRHLWALLPHTRDDKRWFVGVALTAGICEEVVFRWFGIAYVRWLAPASSDLVVIVLIGVAFGCAHWYQGRLGVLLTGGLGAFFTWLTLATGSIVPAMIVHALIDLRIVALRPLPAPDPVATSPIEPADR